MDDMTKFAPCSLISLNQLTIKQAFLFFLPAKPPFLKLLTTTRYYLCPQYFLNISNLQQSYDTIESSAMRSLPVVHLISSENATRLTTQ
jgi:hypothetical protein